MRLHRIIRRTRSEGPGTRFTLWVQGCHNGCPGCCNRALWDETGGYEITPQALIAQIAATDGIEGVTFLGGEPMEQAAELAIVAAAAHTRGLSVVTFTGLTLEEIQAEADPARLALLRHTDLLIDGPYVQAQRDLSRPWVGSNNQRYLFLTERYSMADIEKCANRVELRLDKGGVLRLSGMGDFAALEAALREKTIMRGNGNGTYTV